MRKSYTLCGINTAINLIRPGAKYAILNEGFIQWDDPRPMPEYQEILDTLEKIKVFEDSIECIEL